MESSATANNPAAMLNNQRRMQTIVDNLNKMRAEQRSLSQKVSELESEATEHRLVIDALKEVNNDRTCYRLIGGILVQQTVDNVRPELEKNFEMLKKTIETYRESVKTKGTAINEYIQQHNLGPLIRNAVDEKSNVSTISGDGSANNENKSKTKDSSKSSILVE
ncbi:Prefoldin subunit 2 [Dermatophagoides pteronyssinus]|uniref:Prefoldin subunit 2 n=1 Tax=Dermatophagoides pteronyssinus TaxID=6956 RepID=A0ABQ8JN97_DERPT|nr:Prefoldin subunit 2 [Dermatophagoides pteronyssinus]